MATYFLLVDAGRQFLDSNGDPLAGGKLTTYEAGTTTEKTSYKDNAGAASHTNPIILDSAGRIPTTYAVWGTTGDYKLKLDDSDDANVWTIDDVTGVNDTGAASTSEWVTNSAAATQASATSFTLVGDQTTVFHPGRRLKISDTGDFYATIITSVYSDPSTTVTVNVDGGSSLTSAMNDLGDLQYGVISAENSSISNSFELIVTGTIASSTASLDLTNLSSDYSMYQLVLWNITPSTGTPTINLRVSVDNGATFLTTNYIVGRYFNSTPSGATGESWQYNAASTQIGLIQSIGTTAGQEGYGIMRFIGPGSRHFRCVYEASTKAADNNWYWRHGMGGYTHATDPIDAIQILPDTGNMDDGSYALYGVRT